ncbi:MAG: alpha-L-fucosidase [Planctomycetota bacterium]
MRKVLMVMIAMMALVTGCVTSPQTNKAETINTVKIPDEQRAQQVKDLKFGMFICWSFSTFSGYEWTKGVTDVAYFKATGCDTDQWCRTAKDAGMNYILFLTKHHDGFCLWDTETTDFKVTNSPLGIDVLAKLKKSCDKYGLKLALYFSEGDWDWIEEELPKDGILPDGKQWKNPIWKSSNRPDLKKAQLKELCTKYGPIEFFWTDHAQGTGGLDHKATVDWIHKFQPNCFVGFNHGSAAGRLCLRERGRPGKLGDVSTTKLNKEAERSYKGYMVAEFTYPILPRHTGGAVWFYSLPKHDQLCRPAEQLYNDYLGAIKYGNIFSIDVGPNYEGKIREIDVKTLKEVGQMIKQGKGAYVP